MTKHPRLRPIPGQSDPHVARLAKYRADYLMATDALRDLPFPAMLEAFQEVLEARPDVDPETLEQFANRIGRRAHMEGRKQ